jgi:hypothetical protein
MPGDQAGGQELGHRKLGDGGVDHQDDRRRNQDVGRAAGGDAAGREAVVVAGLAQFGQRHARHGGGIGERRARHRAEAGGGNQRRNGEAAAEAGEDDAGRLEQFARHAGFGRHLAHQDEQRHHRQRIRRGDVERRGAEQGESTLPAERDGVAEEADQDQRNPDRHAQNQQREQDADAENADQRRTHSMCSVSGTAGRATITMSAARMVPASPRKAAIHIQ